MLNIPEDIKKIIMSDSARYNIRIHFPNGERTDICNDKIVNGTARFTESLANQKIVLGLCDSPVFECETVGVGDIKNCEIEVFYELLDAGTEFKTDLQKYVYTIPCGHFIVTEAERQSDLQHRKVTAYGGLESVYGKLSRMELMKSSLGFQNKLTYHTTLPQLVIANTFNQVIGSENTTLPNGNTTLYYKIGERHGTEEYLYIKCVTSNYNTFMQTKGRLYYFNDYVDPIALKERLINAINNIYAQEGEAPLDETQLYLINGALKEDYDVYNNTKLYGTGFYANQWVRFDSYKNHYGQGLVHENVNMVILPNELFNPYINDSYTNYMVYIPIEIGYKGYCSTGYEDDLRKIETLRELETVVQIYLGLKSVSIDSAIDFDVVMDGATILDEAPYRINSDELIIPIDKARDALKNWIESKGKIGKVTRTGALALIDLNTVFDLLPDAELMPSEDLKPQGFDGQMLTPKDYTNFWYSERYNVPYLAIKYKYYSGGQWYEDIYENYIYSAKGEYDTYDLTQNKEFEAKQITRSDIFDFIDNVIQPMFLKMRYVPMTLQCNALPFIETGDTLQVLTANDDNLTTFVINRTIAGESYITDEITSK